MFRISTTSRDTYQYATCRYKCEWMSYHDIPCWLPYCVFTWVFSPSRLWPCYIKHDIYMIYQVAGHHLIYSRVVVIYRNSSPRFSNLSIDDESVYMVYSLAALHPAKVSRWSPVLVWGVCDLWILLTWKVNILDSFQFNTPCLFGREMMPRVLVRYDLERRIVACCVCLST